ncbi:hypothetical protein U9R90_18690 [Streptomyces sp. E11-3]|uniref:hypothetical protein n=1 Tax=Streptomyces sp. E11-3 TaxID=3110112 RepID=UPI0039814C13
MSAYIHEWTHHWCFHSAVGNALVALAVRADGNAQVCLLRRVVSESAAESAELDVMARSFAELAEEFGGLGRRVPPLPPAELSEAEWAVLDAMVRFHIAVRLLRPLAEGLALFAEHDAVSRLQSRAASSLTWNLAFHFSDRRILATNDTVVEPFASMAAAASVLHDARLSPDGLAAKASLLASPLSAAGQGYLPGYLAIKSLWWHLCKQDSRLATETDLALTYLRAYFYDDPELVTLLLSPDHADPLVSARRIALRLQQRLIDFERITAGDIRAFEDHLISYGETGERNGTPGILADGASDLTATVVAEVLSSLHEGRLRELLGEKFSLAQHQILVRTLNRRPYLTVSHVPVETYTHGGGAGMDVSWQGQHLFTAPASDLQPGTRPGVRKARLEVLAAQTMSPEGSLGRGAFVTDGDRLLSFTMIEESDVRLREKMLEHYWERGALTAAPLHAVADALVTASPELKIPFDHIMDQADQEADSLYRDTALWTARDHTAADRSAEVMREDGMLPLLGSVRLLNCLALLGLATGLHPLREQTADVFRAFGFDLDWTLNQLDSCWNTHGYPPRVGQSAPLLLSWV